MFPVITVSGTAYERGHQYGARARDRVARSLAAYADLFAYYAGWDWGRVVEEARRFVAPITDFGPEYLEEMRGIADGAGVPLDDILAINIRTEIIFAAKARNSGAPVPPPMECSSFATVAPDDSVRLGQNWDWQTHALDTVVVLQAVPDSGPRYLTVVEAGLLAKFGLNSEGLGVVTNALVTSDDRGEPGVPYHLLLRALLDCRTPREALARLNQATRSSSANYLVAHRSGLAMDIEASPGDFSHLYLHDPDPRGVVLHTNHFLTHRLDGVDVGLWSSPGSPFRLQRLRRGVAAADDPHDLGVFERLLTDHAGRPASVCCHPDPALPDLERGTTVTSALIELCHPPSMRLAEGPPCASAYEKIDCSFLSDD